MSSPPVRWWEKEDLEQGVIIREQRSSQSGPCRTEDALPSCGGQPHVEAGSVGLELERAACPRAMYGSASISTQTARKANGGGSLPGDRV